MFWPNTTEPSGPVGWQFGALKRSKKLHLRDAHRVTVCSYVFLEISFKPSLDPCFWPLARSSPARNEKTRVRAQLRPPAIDVRPRHFPWKSAESERFAPSNHSAARSPATRLLHTMKTICESCCDSPATLVACGREGTVLCGTCDTPRYAPADVTFFFAPASATRPSMGHPRRPRKTVEHPSWRRTRHARTRR